MGQCANAVNYIMNSENADSCGSDTLNTVFVGEFRRGSYERDERLEQRFQTQLAALNRSSAIREVGFALSHR